MPFLLNTGWRDHHQSSLSGEELLALADQIILIPGLQAPGESVHDFWRHVSNQLQTNTLYITKGIHEPDRLHFNVFIESPKDLRWEKTVEVFVKRGTTAVPVTSQPFDGKGIHKGKTVQRNLFDYEVKGMSAMISNTQQNFPSHFFFGTHAIDRRMSFSIGNSSKPAVRNDFKADVIPVKKAVAKK